MLRALLIGLLMSAFSSDVFELASGFLLLALVLSTLLLFTCHFFIQLCKGPYIMRFLEVEVSHDRQKSTLSMEILEKPGFQDPGK